MICLVKRQLPYVEKIHQFCPVIQFCFVYIHLGAVARQFFRGFLKFSQPHLDKKNLKNQFSKNQVLGGFGSKSFAQNSFGSMSFGFWVLAQNLTGLTTTFRLNTCISVKYPIHNCIWTFEKDIYR